MSLLLPELHDTVVLAACSSNLRDHIEGLPPAYLILCPFLALSVPGREAAGQKLCNCSLHPAGNGPHQPLHGDRLRMLPPVEYGFHDLRREESEPEQPSEIGRVDPLRPGQLLDRAYSPPSSIPCQRCARAMALTSVLSTRTGRGAQAGSPSGETTCFLPPRLRKASGTCAVTLCPSQATSAPVLMPLAYPACRP